MVLAAARVNHSLEVFPHHAAPGRDCGGGHVYGPPCAPGFGFFKRKANGIQNKQRKPK